jgi:transcriptional regulator with XRE-family HTH domain/DNA-binding Xre family transcriptional regulator
MNKFDFNSVVNYVKNNVMSTNISYIMRNEKITFKKMSSELNISESNLKNAITMSHSALSTLDKICDFYNIPLPDFDNFNYGAYCGREQAIIDLTNYLNTTLYHLSKKHNEEFEKYKILIAYEFLFNNRVYIPSSIRRKSKFINLNEKLTVANDNVKKVIEKTLNKKGLKFKYKFFQSVSNAPLTKYKISYDIHNASFSIKKSDINNTSNNIGNYLQNIRTNNNLTLAQFGNIFKLDKSTIKNIESGREILKYDYVKWICALFNDVNINKLITNEQASLNLNYDLSYDNVTKSCPDLSAFKTRDFSGKLRKAIQFLSPEPSFIQDYERLEVLLAITSTGFKIKDDFLFESFYYPNVKLNTKDIEWLNTEIKKAVKNEYKDDLTRKYTKICFKEFYHYDRYKNQISLTDDKLISIIEKLQEPKRP